MRPLRYSINVTLDGCCDHTAMSTTEELHHHATETIARADALILGRVTYQMMESAWRPSLEESGMAEWTAPFAHVIGAAKKYVVSSTLADVDWNAELVHGDVEDAVRRLKEESGAGLYVGGVTLPRALAAWGLIDTYEFIVHPVIAGHGPSLFDGLPRHLELRQVGERPFACGAVSRTYVPLRGSWHH